jgi:hypothetical protein
MMLVIDALRRSINLRRNHVPCPYRKSKMAERHPANWLVVFPSKFTRLALS